MNLTKYVAQVSEEDFGWPFRHEARFNSRLRTTGGRFFPHDGHLEFNPKHFEALPLETFRKIVRHELCHYHLYFQKRGYRHRDSDFKKLLAQVDGLRYAPTLDQRQALIYSCQNCHQTYYRQRRLDLKRYRCGLCRGRLVFIENQSQG